MPTADIAALLASLPTLIFVPGSEAPPSGGQCLAAPADAEWCTAHYEAERGLWFSADGMPMDAPLVYALLPPAPGRHSPGLVKGLAQWIVDLIEDGDYAKAASLIDELADGVRALRDNRSAG